MIPKSITFCLEDRKKSCGCDFMKFNCGCVLPTVTVTRSELNRMTKGELFKIYTRTISDEMSPIWWRGYTKEDILDMFCQGSDSCELTPFY